MSRDGAAPDDARRQVLLMVEAEPTIDPEEAERLARQLRAELDELDVDSVVPAPAGQPPEFAKGIDPKKQENVEGRIILARNIHWTLPAHLRLTMRSPVEADRLTALDGLARLYRSGNDHVRAEIRNHIRTLAEDHSDAVRAGAATLLRTPHPDEAQRSGDDTPASASPVGLKVTAPASAVRAVTRPSIPSTTRLARRLAHIGGLRTLGRGRDNQQPSTAPSFGVARGRPGPRRRAVLAGSAVLVALLLVGSLILAARWVALPPTIAVGVGPAGVAITPDGSRAYVTNYTSGTVSMIDTSVLAVSGTIPVGGSPVGVALGPQGSPVYVADNDDDSGALKQIDTASEGIQAIRSTKPTTECWPPTRGTSS